jgi:hypothetical protein
MSGQPVVRWDDMNLVEFLPYFHGLLFTLRSFHALNLP